MSEKILARWSIATEECWRWLEIEMPDVEEAKRFLSHIRRCEDTHDTEIREIDNGGRELTYDYP